MLPLHILYDLLIVSNIEICLKYFLDKNPQKQPLWYPKHSLWSAKTAKRQIVAQTSVWTPFSLYIVETYSAHSLASRSPVQTFIR